MTAANPKPHSRHPRSTGMAGVPRIRAVFPSGHETLLRQTPPHPAAADLRAWRLKPRHAAVLCTGLAKASLAYTVVIYFQDACQSRNDRLKSAADG